MLLKSEAKQLNIPITSRMCLKNLSVKQWLIYIVILVISIPFAMVAVQLVEPFMKVTGLIIPDYIPFFLNPAINPADADPSVLSPGLRLKEQFILRPLISITLLLNILAEELYFRAWILPKLSKYGNIGWIINAVLFADSPDDFHTSRCFSHFPLFSAMIIFILLRLFCKSFNIFCTGALFDSYLKVNQSRERVPLRCPNTSSTVPMQDELLWHFSVLQTCAEY